MIVELPRLDAAPQPDAGAPANLDHPMRRVTEAVVDGSASWTHERTVQVAAVFDDLAAGWEERIGGGGHLSALVDALDRGEVTGSGAIEVGSGTGAATATLAARFATVVAVDLSLEMLRRAPADVGPRVLADAAQLPLADGWADVVVLLNVFLFPAEVDRVLDPRGAVVWVSSIGPAHAHLPAGGRGGAGAPRSLGRRVVGSRRGHLVRASPRPVLVTVRPCATS